MNVNLTEIDERVFAMLEAFYKENEPDTMKPHIIGMGVDDDGHPCIKGVAMLPDDVPRELMAALVKGLTEEVLKQDEVELAVFVTEAYMSKLDKEKVPDVDDEQAVIKYLSENPDAKVEACIVSYAWDGATRALVAHEIKDKVLVRGDMHQDGYFGGAMTINTERVPEGATIH